MSFLILRDKTGYCQVIVPKTISEALPVESVVEIIGEVKETNQSTAFSIEIIAEELKVISIAEALPDVGAVPFWYFGVTETPSIVTAEL